MLEMFCSKAESLTVGLLASIVFSEEAPRDKARNVEFRVSPPVRDKFGDSIAEVKVLLGSDEFFPAIKLRLRNSVGQVGFDMAGLGSLFAVLFEGAILVSEKSDSFAYELGYDELLEKGVDVLSMRGGIPAPVMCANVKDGFFSYLQSSIEDFKSEAGIAGALIGLLDYCDAVFVWSFANGTNPVVLSLDMPSFIGGLSPLLAEQKVNLIMVRDEGLLPSW